MASSSAVSALVIGGGPGRSARMYMPNGLLGRCTYHLPQEINVTRLGTRVGRQVADTLQHAGYFGPFRQLDREIVLQRGAEGRGIR